MKILIPVYLLLNANIVLQVVIKLNLRMYNQNSTLSESMEVFNKSKTKVPNSAVK